MPKNHLEKFKVIVSGKCSLILKVPSNEIQNIQMMARVSVLT